MEEITLEMIEESRWQFQMVVDYYTTIADKEKLPRLTNQNISMLLDNPETIIDEHRKSLHINSPARNLSDPGISSTVEMIPVKDSKLFTIKYGEFGYARVSIVQERAEQLIEQSKRKGIYLKVIK
jgi:hypothetical protein